MNEKIRNFFSLKTRKVFRWLGVIMIAIYSFFAGALIVDFDELSQVDNGAVKGEKEELVGVGYKYATGTSFLGDFLGDGRSYKAMSHGLDDYYFGEDVPDFNGRIVIYAPDSSVVAKTPDDVDLGDSGVARRTERVVLDDSGKDFLKVTKVVGTHHARFLFLGVKGEYIVPICRTPETYTFDCEFYNTVGEIGIADLDDNGKYEVFEFVDEYPPGGGRGRTVVNSIYTFNGSYFEENTDMEYDRLYQIITRTYPEFEFLRKSEWTKESQNNAQTVQDFWEGKYK